MYKKLSHLQVKHSEQRKLGVCLKTTATDVAEKRDRSRSIPFHFQPFSTEHVSSPS